MESLWQDVRYAWRRLAHSPGFTGVAVLTLALGIGANTAIFSVFNAAFLRPLPYRDPERLFTVWNENVELARGIEQKMGWFPYRSGRFHVAGRAYLDWKDQLRAFDQVAAWDTLERRFVLTGSAEPEEVRGVRISASLFPLLGVQPFLGRNFLEEEDRPGPGGIVLLEHGLWQRRFGSDPSILGKAIVLNGRSFSVVGVMPTGFSFPPADLWVPLALGSGNPCELRFSCKNFLVLARLARGVSRDRARDELKAYAAQIEKEHPQSERGWGYALVPLKEHVVGDLRTPLMILLGAAGILFVIACTNVANLQLVRATAQRKELAIRAALGAIRPRLLRQLLSESVLVWLLGGSVGLLLAVWGKDLLLALSPQNLPQGGESGIDARVLSFTILLSLLTAVLFGLIPAVSASQPELNESLKEGGIRAGTGARGQRARNALVVSELALALILTIAAGLLTNSFLRLWRVPLGFSPENLLTLRLSLPGYKYASPDRRAAFFQQLLERLAGNPEVVAAGAAFPFPFSGEQQAVGFAIEGNAAEGLSTNLRAITPDYFRAMGIPLVTGRGFTDRDTEGSAPVMVINETMARQFWPNGNALGHRIALGNEMGHPAREIVGIVRDTRHAGLNYSSGPEMYLPYFQRAQRATMFLALHTRSDPMRVVAAARAQVQAMDKDQPVEDIRTMQQRLSGSAAPWRFYMLLIGLFGSFSLILAAIGIYGVVAYSATQRTREIGIRMALGAQPRDVFHLVMERGMVLTLAGIAIGIGAAVALTRVMSSLLFGVTPTDPVTFGSVALLLAAVALLASYLPARRATRIDPMTALRYE